VAVGIGVQPTFLLLGPFAVLGLERGALGGPKQRAMLAYLLLHSNELVPRDRLVDTIWGGQPPTTAVAIVHSYIAKLRTALRDTPAQIVTRSPGYVLELDEDTVDAYRFERLAREGRSALRAGDAERAREVLGEALGLWQGEALADLAYEPSVQAEAARLEAARLDASMDRVDAELQLGETPVADLERLVGRHPLEERLRGQLMLALYRAGRQADALEAYRAARRTFVSEVGVEPGPALRELEQSILRQEPTLLREAPPMPPRAPRQRRRRRSTWLIASATVALAGAAAAAVVLLTGGSNGSTSIAPNHIALLDSHGRVEREIQVGDQPVALGATNGTLWVANRTGKSVMRIDERSGQVATIPLPGHPTAVAPDPRGAWIVEAPEHRLVRVDTEFDRVTNSLPLDPGSATGGIVRAAGALWTTSRDTTLEERDPTTGRIRRRWVPDLGATNLAYGGGTLWVGGPNGVTPFEPATGLLPPIPLLGPVQAIAAGPRAAWNVVAAPSGWRIQKVDSRTLTVVGSAAVGSNPTAVAVAPSSAWVADLSDGMLTQLDSDTLATSTRPVGASPTALAWDVHGLWVAAS